MILGLDHAQVSIPIGAEDQAREFYCGFLGLREIEKPSSLQGRGGFWLELGSVQVHFGVEDGIDREKTKSHLAYRVSDISYWKKKLQLAQMNYRDGTPIAGTERIEFRDPFGNRVEMIART